MQGSGTVNVRVLNTPENLITTERRATLAQSSISLSSDKYYIAATPNLRYIQGIYLRHHGKIPPFFMAQMKPHQDNTDDFVVAKQCLH